MPRLNHAFRLDTEDPPVRAQEPVPRRLPAPAPVPTAPAAEPARSDRRFERLLVGALVTLALGLAGILVHAAMHVSAFQ